jgi:hypothetical protein
VADGRMMKGRRGGTRAYLNFASSYCHLVIHTIAALSVYENSGDSLLNTFDGIRINPGKAPHRGSNLLASPEVNAVPIETRKG